MISHSIIQDILRTKLFSKALSSQLIRFDWNQSQANGATIFFRQILDWTLRLEKSIQYPEFTDHGLNHVLSLSVRISDWSLSNNKFLVDTLTPNECFLLASAVMLHDIGMLSQKLEDLPEDKRYSDSYFNTDIRTWVRNTHVIRIENLVLRLLKQCPVRVNLKGSNTLGTIILLAKSHHEWPNDRHRPCIKALFNNHRAQKLGTTRERLVALAGVLAVSDLLDEEHSRLDAEALLEHKHGTALNKSHWIRHYLVADSLNIYKGIVLSEKVSSNNKRLVLKEFPFWKKRIESSKIAMENHLYQVERYNKILEPLNANLKVPKILWKKWDVKPFNPSMNSLDNFVLFPDIQILRSFHRGIIRIKQSNNKKDYERALKLDDWLANQPSDLPEELLMFRAVKEFEQNYLKEAIQIIKNRIAYLKAIGQNFSQVDRLLNEVGYHE